VAASARIRQMMESSSWIRRMFETGNQLRARYGADKVCDFSLGNPDVEPPAEFQAALRDVVEAKVPHKHGYMANAGYPEARARVAEYVSKEQGVALGGENIVMSCGAGGGLNAALKTILNPGDEVIVSAPCFVEYGFYAENHGGKLVMAPSARDFNLDVAAIESKITRNTAALIINSPNNPTGRVYPEETLRELARMLSEASRRIGRTITIVSDEPYRKLVFDGIVVPGVMRLYPHSIVVSSSSKDLSIPGERIGYVAVSPGAEDSRALVDGVILCTRILGFVNAPALMQRVVARLQGVGVDVSVYRAKRDLFCAALQGIGYELVKPQGAFYIFPKAPGGDDLAFIQALQEDLVLAVPGRGFALPGYFRIAFCVDTDVIERSFAGFEKAYRKFSG
jgi:aspartate aminotransferase